MTNQEKWNGWVESNKDDAYGKACVDVARKVMELIDGRPDEPLTSEYKGRMSVHALICEADREVKAGGLTGFMAGCVAQMVVECHSRGEEFKTAWNKLNNVSDRVNGVANPALMTIEV